MLRKKLTMFLTGVTLVLVALSGTAAPAGATTGTTVTASVVGSAVPSDVMPFSWFKHSEWPAKWACNEYGEFLVTESSFYCNWSCTYRGGVYELWVLWCD